MQNGVGLTETERREHAVSLTEYAPRRARTEAPALTIVHPASEEALSEDIKENAFRWSTMIGNLMERERQAQKDLSHERARIEQFEARVGSLESERETLKAQLDAERADRIRLSSILENVGGLVADGLQAGA